VSTPLPDLRLVNTNGRAPRIFFAPHVGASLDVMERDAKKMRGARPFVFTNLKSGSGVDTVVSFIRDKGGLGA